MTVVPDDDSPETSEVPVSRSPGTAGAAIDFLTYTVEKGYLKAPTANAMKVAVREVMRAAEGENWESIKLASIDAPDVLRRFSTLRAMKYKPESLDTYGKRFSAAIEMYQAFAEDPAAWRPGIRSRSARAPRSSASGSRPTGSTAERGPSTTGTERNVQDSSVAVGLETSDRVPQRVSLIPYPFPLREDVLVSLHLPPDLSRREASRLTNFIQSLAVDEDEQRHDPTRES